MKKIAIIYLVLLLCAPFLWAQNQWKVVHKELVFSNPPFKQCHASTIVQLSSGKMMSAWFGGKDEGAKDVCIWTSVNEKGIWKAPSILATGIINDSLRYPCWNPVLFMAKNKKLLLFYKVGPTPELWWGMTKTSVDEGKTWSAPIRLPEGILGPIKNKPVLLADGTILSPSSVEIKDRWTAHIERSIDNGTTWQKIAIDTTGFDVIQPSILNYGAGKLQILCRSKQGVVVESWSKDNGNTWGKLSATALLNPDSGTDAVTLKSGQQLIVYNPTSQGKEWNDGREKLHVAISKDGTNWEDIITLENGKKKEFSYPAVIQATDGRVHITYTYDRKNIKYVVLEKKN